MTQKKLLTFLFLLFAFSSAFGQLSNFSFTKPKKKREIIQDIQQSNDYYKQNHRLFFKGTRSRTEYKCNDSTLQNCAFYRKTSYNENGEITLDSILTSSNEIIVTQRIESNSFFILKEMKKDEVLKADTFRLDIHKNPIEHRNGSHITTWEYDAMNRLVREIKKTSYTVEEELIHYYADSIIVFQTEKNFRGSGLGSIEIRKEINRFIRDSLLVEDSSYTIKTLYHPRDLSKVLRKDSSSTSLKYFYDNTGRHIKTFYDLHTEFRYQDGKVIEEISYYKDGTINQRIIRSYPNKTTLHSKTYVEGNRLVNEIILTYRNNKIVKAIDYNTTFEIHHTREIRLDEHGRRIVFFDIQGDETDYRKIVYEDYK